MNSVDTDFNFNEVISKDIVFEKDNINYKYIQNVNFYRPICNKVLNEQLFKVVSDLLEESAYFINMEIHDKAPLVGTPTPAHQDNFYFRLNPPSALTVYIPLEKHDASINGGLKFVRNSHSQGTKDHASAEVKAFSSKLNAEVNSEMVFNTQLNQGDIVIHHCNTVHFADSNKSKLHRRSLSLRFNGYSAKVDPDMHKKYIENYKVNRKSDFE